MRCDAVACFFAPIFGSGRRFDLVLTRANGQPRSARTCAVLMAFDTAPDCSWSGSLDNEICALTRFESGVLPWFGLPRSLPHDGALR